MVESNTYRVVFLVCFSFSWVPILPVYLDCPFLIDPSVFSNIYADGVNKLLLFTYNTKWTKFPLCHNQNKFWVLVK